MGLEYCASKPAASHFSPIEECPLGRWCTYASAQSDGLTTANTHTGEGSMCKCQTLQPDRKLDIAGRNHVLDFEVLQRDPAARSASQLVCGTVESVEEDILAVASAHLELCRELELLNHLAELQTARSLVS